MRKMYALTVSDWLIGIAVAVAFCCFPGRFIIPGSEFARACLFYLFLFFLTPGEIVPSFRNRFAFCFAIYLYSFLYL